MFRRKLQSIMNKYYLLSIIALFFDNIMVITIYVTSRLNKLQLNLLVGTYNIVSTLSTHISFINIQRHFFYHRINTFICFSFRYEYHQNDNIFMKYYYDSIKYLIWASH